MQQCTKCHATPHDLYFADVQYLLTHRSSDIQAPWTFSIHNNNYISVFQAWNWQSNGMDSTGTATGSASDVSTSPFSVTSVRMSDVGPSLACCHIEHQQEQEAGACFAYSDKKRIGQCPFLG